MAKKSSIKYSDGTVFLVPLEDGISAVGVVIRSSGRKGVVMGLFFRQEDLPVSELKKEKSIFTTLFGDSKLASGSWPVIGQIPEWSPDTWPVPWLPRIDPYITKTAWRVKCGEDNASEFGDEERIRYDSPLVASGLMDGVAGPEYLEHVLKSIIIDKAVIVPPAEAGCWSD